MRETVKQCAGRAAAGSAEEAAADPVFQGAKIPMFYCGDDSDAKRIAAQLATELGFDPIDAGPLTNARILEPHAFLWIWLALKGGLGRNFAFEIVRR